jgi:hypothetical protein
MKSKAYGTFSRFYLPRGWLWEDRGKMQTRPRYLDAHRARRARQRPAGRRKNCGVAAGGNYGGGQLSLVSEVFVVTTWQVLSIQYSVTPSWKIVQRLKFHPDWIPSVPVEVSL